MEIILKLDVDKVGKSGQVVKVKDGFARNFLIPNGLAVPRTAANLKKLEQERLRKSQEEDKIKQAAFDLKAKLEGLSLTIAALTQDDDKMYGAIGAADIAEVLREEGLTIDKNSILLAEPIKSLGIYEIAIKLHSQVEAKVKAWVVKK